MEQPSTLHVTNGTSTLGPGSPCRRRTDCGGDMVCLASGTCGCSELSPVLVSDAEDFACVSPRRLKEPCLIHAQCSHSNKRALCLSSVCSCPSRFRASSDRSECLPEALTFNLLSLDMLPAVLLILGFAILGILSYRRLYKTPADKARDLQDLSFSLGNTCGPAYGMCLDKTVDLSHESGSDVDISSRSAWSRLHSFAENTTLGLSATKRCCQWPLPDSNASCTMTHEEELAKSPCVSFPKHRGTRRQISSSCLPQPSVVTGRLASRSSSELASEQTVPSAYSPPTSTQKSGHPIPKKRTRVQTLSTSTLMPPRRAHRRSNSNFPSGSSTPGTFAYRNPQGFWKGGMSSLHETDAEANTEEPENASTLFIMPPSSASFTASELRASAPKKFASEKLEVTPLKQMRRAVSELGGKLAAVPEECTEDSSCGCPGCPNVHFCAPTDESLSTFGWDTESCMKFFADEDSHNEAMRSLLTCSQPTWPCQRVVWKGPDRRARTCEAFAFHHARVGSKQVKRPRQPWSLMESRSRSPASGDFSSWCQLREAMTDSTALSAAQCDTPWASVSYVQSMASSSPCPHSSCEPQLRGSANCGMSPVGRSATQEVWPRWRGGAQTPDSAFGENAAMFWEHIPSGGSEDTVSLTPTLSTDLPLSLCSLHSCRTECSCYLQRSSSDN
ncbi:uncharacterized protein LOC144098722 isoform X4 [Amblyomma americanum]